MTPVGEGRSIPRPGPARKPCPPRDPPARHMPVCGRGRGHVVELQSAIRPVRTAALATLTPGTSHTRTGIRRGARSTRPIHTTPAPRPTTPGAHSRPDADSHRPITHQTPCVMARTPIRTRDIPRTTPAEKPRRALKYKGCWASGRGHRVTGHRAKNSATPFFSLTGAQGPPFLNASVHILPRRLQTAAGYMPSLSATTQPLLYVLM